MKNINVPSQEDKKYNITWIAKEHSGLPLTIGLLQNIKSDEAPHLLVQGHFAPWYFIERCVRISISEDPRLLNCDDPIDNEVTVIRDFIRRNTDCLLGYWKQEMELEDMKLEWKISNLINT